MFFSVDSERLQVDTGQIQLQDAMDLVMVTLAPLTRTSLRFTWSTEMSNQPNWPSKQEDQKSGGGRDNNAPKK